MRKKLESGSREMGSAGGAIAPWILASLVALAAVCSSTVRGASQAASSGRGRSLLGFRETLGNASFQCSPSGPCIPCQYIEKNDKKYRCSETGYRLPLKCVETQGDSKEEPSKSRRKLLFQSGNMVGSMMQKRHFASVSIFKFRKLMDDSSTSESKKQSYITYRSCIPADGEEKLSVLGFELIMVCLILLSGPVVYLRQKRPALMPGNGAVRIPSNSPRF